MKQEEFVFTYSYRCLFDLSIDEKIKLIDKLVDFLHLIVYNTIKWRKKYDEKKASILFQMVDWQSPESLLYELDWREME